MSLKLVFLPTLIVASITSVINSVQAAQIIQAQSVSTDLGQSGSFVIDDAINQSGLSINYISGVTDFDNYLSENPTHSFLDSWLSQLTLPGSVTFDLGSVIELDAMVMWGTGGLFSAEDFELSASLTGEDGSFVTLGSFTQDFDSGDFSQVFEFSTTTAQFIRMDIISSYISSNEVGIGEVAFSGSNMISQSTPEPSTIFGIGIGTVIAFGKRFKHKLGKAKKK